MRLNVFVAKSGCAARRKADELIKQGLIKVNGQVIDEPACAITYKDKVTYNDKLLKPQEYFYLIFNKPKGTTSTRQDKFAQRVIIDHLPEKLKNLYPAGRLDRDSTGLIVLTNDGNLCYQMTHPKFEVEKEYVLELSGQLTAMAQQKALAGILDQGQLLKVKKIELIKQLPKTTIIKTIVCEGKKRHLRRLFERIGFNVLSLHRIRIGKLVLGSLRQGEYNLLTREQTYSLILGTSMKKKISNF
jgi:23S rRNA pseudouridine2605 synthase